MSFPDHNEIEAEISDGSLARQQRFVQLLEPVHDRLYRFAYALTRSRGEARELMADTMLKAFEQFDSLKSEEAFLSFMFTIARRTFKRQQWRSRLFRPVEEGFFDQQDAAQSAPDQNVDVELLGKAMERLPDSQREAIMLFHLSGLSLEEIRSIQGGSLSGVKNRLKRGRAKLAKLLDADKHLEALPGATSSKTVMPSARPYERRLALSPLNNH